MTCLPSATSFDILLMKIEYRQGQRYRSLIAVPQSEGIPTRIFQEKAHSIFPVPSPPLEMRVAVPRCYFAGKFDILVCVSQ